jgi:hypothetical protein
MESLKTEIKEVKSPKTNTQHFINAIVRASNETMTVINNGDPNTKGFIVIHNGAGYIVPINDKGEITGCTCHHHFYRNAICKHMIKVAMQKGLSLSDIPAITEKEEKVEDANNVTQLPA